MARAVTRAAANNTLPAGSARIAFGGQARRCASGYQSVSGRSTKAPLGEPGSVVVVVGGAVVVVAVGAVVVVSDGTEVVVVSCGGDVVVVLVPPEMHEPSAHASQQLGSDPTHAVPSCGALQSLSLCLMLHFVWPCSSVRQQVTKSGLPQVDCAAQCTTASLHSWRSDPSLVAASATCCTQLTYLP